MSFSAGETFLAWGQGAVGCLLTCGLRFSLRFIRFVEEAEVFGPWQRAARCWLVLREQGMVLGALRTACLEPAGSWGVAFCLLFVVCLALTKYF